MPEYPWIIYRMSEGPLTTKEVHQGVNEQLNRKLGTDWGYSEYEWAGLLQGFRPLPIRTASGTIAHFEDGAEDVPMKSIVANITPIQDLHGYSKPWAAGAGKNKCLFISDGQVPSISDGGLVNYNGCRTDYIKAKASTQYTFSGTVAVATCYFFYYDANHDFISYQQGQLPMTRTTPSDCAYVMLRNDSSLSDIVNAQFEEGSTATSYEPYANVCPISGTDELTLKHDNDNMLSLPTFDFTIQGVRVYTNEDGNVVLNGTSTGGISSDNALWKDNLRFSLPKGHYYLSCNSFSTYGAVVVVKNTDTNATICQFNSNWQIDLTETTPMRIGIYIPADKTFDNFVCNFEASLDNITYDVPNRETYTFDLGQEIMGGTADCVGGVGESTHKLINLADLTWTLQNGAFYSQPLTDAKSVTDAQIFNGVSSHFVSVSYNYLYAKVTDNSIAQSSSKRIYIYSSAITTLEQLETAIADAQLAYELATPTEYTFTGQPINSYLGVNNLYVDSGEVLDVKYRSNF